MICLQRPLSIIASMSEVTLLLYMAQTWTLESLSAKITESRNTLPSLAELRAQNMLSVTNHTKLNIIGTLFGVVRQISRLIHYA